ncbi:CpsD/CapB family tyrosine-protein kinase [Paenibacillus sacheonensis]|uniref:non-specific protein-tyrosine kinase n=1 Tax=Paenibacillus sacheonensis TaxID=742054 RepID=A0A7X5C1Z1_9BACL|nr:CpsD/CapB family tyrosine-protein kinase [Paenibacillus sacheonensis]NBC69904.1 polysaccharide biosynthesis tyrosine autokinase [Paenibacillus sacheonensis]
MRRSTVENNLVTLQNPKSPISEVYRTLRTNLQLSSIDSPMKIMMVTSAQRREGKTTTVSNLAIAYAQEGKKVLLIDTDLREPSLHAVFNMSNRNGLTSILSNQVEWREIFKESVTDNLTVLTSGPIPPNPSELLSSRRMQELLEELKEEFDIILFDTPPILVVTDGLVVSNYCDGVILVVVSGKVDKELVVKAKANLEHVNARIAGVVLNKMNAKYGKRSTNYYYGARE